MDIEEKTVTISGDKKLEYDYLILATGSRTKNYTPFKGLESTEETKHALHDFQSEVTKSKNIVVAGAGVTGIEVAGELAFALGSEKQITLVWLTALARSCLSLTVTDFE